MGLNMIIPKKNEFALQLLEILGLPNSGCTGLTIDIKASNAPEVCVKYVLQEDEKILELIKRYQLVDRQ